MSDSPDFQDPKLTLRLIKRLKAEGLTESDFKQLHHFGQTASMNVHEGYCAATGRFRAQGENADLARRLRRILDELSSQSLRALIAKHRRRVAQ